MANVCFVSPAVSPLLHVLASQRKLRKLPGDFRELSFATADASHFQNLYEIEKTQRTGSKSRQSMT
jgi:hypothetical protein